MKPEIKKLGKLLSQGSITRREFMAGLSALGVSGALFPILSADSARAAVSKKGGRLRLGIAGSSTKDTLDPGTISNAMARSLSWQIRNNLVEIDYQGNAVPELAEIWEASADAATWRFTLRKGVEFHNGKTLVADDVLSSVNHHRGKKTTSGLTSLVGSIQDIAAEGKYTVVFRLKQGVADFPYIMSDHHIPIFPSGTRGPDFEKGIGTGGYVLKEWAPGYRALTRRNPNYWKQGRAHFDEVELQAIPIVTERMTALNTGRIDAMNRFELKLIHLVKRVRDIQIINTNGHMHYTMPMLTDRKPFNNNDTCLALKYAIDREDILKKILRGYGTLGNDHPIAPNQKYFASELPQRRYDPDKAKFHMKKAGFLDYPFRLHGADIAFEGAVDAAYLYKKHAAAAGITINVVKEPYDAYWEDVWIKKPWMVSYWAGRATADWMFSVAYAENSKWNDSLWKHERFNQLLKEARAELDEKKRREMYVECQKIVRDEGGAVIPVFAHWIEAAAKKVKFENLAGNWELDGGRAAERWWFAS